MIVFFDDEHRKLVRKLHYIIFDKSGTPASYRFEGVQKDEFLNFVISEPMKQILYGKNTQKDGDELKKIRFNLQNCIEKRFIIEENEKLMIGYDGARLISKYYYLDRINLSIIISIVSLVISIIAIMLNYKHVL